MSAIISECERYRYRLERAQENINGPIVAFYGVNPSTAGALAEDQTTMKWGGFARIMGASKYVAGNPFAFRTAHVQEIAAVDDPVGPENASHLAQIIAAADIHIPCWGNRSKVANHLQPHFDTLLAALVASGKPIKIFGLTKSGDPMHPLMLGYKTPLIDWLPTVFCDLA